MTDDSRSARAQALAARPVFETRGGFTATWRDVVDLARPWGTWDEAARQAASAAAARRAPSGTVQLEPGALRRGIRQYRRERGLLAAEDLQRWVSERGLAADDVVDHVQGRLLAAQLAAGDEATPPSAVPLEAGDDDAAELLDARCSGTISTEARRAAGRVAYLEQRGRSVPADASDLAAAFGEALDEEVTPDRRDAALASHAMDWARVRLRYVVVGEASVAQECVACLDRDGRTVDEVASLAGVAVVEEQFILEDAVPAVARAALVAPAGGTVGPVPVAGGMLVGTAAEKVLASLDDEAVWARADQAVRRSLVDAAIGRQVAWHDVL